MAHGSGVVLPGAYGRNRVGVLGGGDILENHALIQPRPGDAVGLLGAGPKSVDE